jgi:hypothetical protein
MSEKRFQVFISSTFRDLINERQAVLKAILELDHMPAGMELFPASDEQAWGLIQDVINGSDYYVLLVGGRYGSLDEEGISYTEKEYDYARKTKKPVIPLLHKNPDNLPRDKTETNQEGWEKLESFRKKVESKHTCVYWESAEDLKAKVIVGLTANFKRHPAIGWIRADSVPTDATLRDVLSLRQKVAALEAQLNEIRTDAPPGTEDLKQGDDTYEFEYKFMSGTTKYYTGATSYEASINLTWNEIFAAVAPNLISELSQPALRQKFISSFSQAAMEELASDEDLKGMKLFDFRFQDGQIDTCIVQLRALGLIKESDKKRSITDKDTYWALTQYGDRTMVQLRALRREPLVRRIPGSKAEVVEDGDVKKST